MNKMGTAPKDGTHILILTETKAYRNKQKYGTLISQWETSGTRIVEAWYNDGKFRPWCGNERTQTTAGIFPLGWWPMPDLLTARIQKAEELIKDLAAHDGAEGFSKSTYEAMEAYGKKWGLS